MRHVDRCQLNEETVSKLGSQSTFSLILEGRAFLQIDVFWPSMFDSKITNLNEDPNWSRRGLTVDNIRLLKLFQVLATQ